ncbi:MAG: phosphate ABC transporter permease subunit PstC [Gammaproteobacteria bacterium HGW-Gammaproteobacteria-11]|nr:MAG: phosphate ABC transporter permease subunit PstC [Gammaproteobacteria bacterium HGW-Gammaproteobacteria-11]
MLTTEKKTRWPSDTLLQGLLGVPALLAAALLALIVGFLIWEAWPAMSGRDGSNLLAFLRSDGWHPLQGQFGMLPMVWASMAAAFGAMLLAVPMGLGSALFSQYLAPAWFSGPFNSMISLLAGIPSVVFGLWGLTVLVPVIGSWQPPGASLLAAILILAMMTLPTVALTSRAALAALPPTLYQGAAMLGMSRHRILIGVLVPAARRGILGGVLLAIARALGETMAVLMVAGNVVQTPRSLFEPIRVLTANIALEMAYAVDHHRASLFVSGLLLMLMVALLAWLAHRLSRSMHHG